jgi:aromatic-L-amino-acid decarboxylase
MIGPQEFRKQAHAVVDFISDYLENIEHYPVKSQVAAGEILSKIPDLPPAEGEGMDEIIRDFREIILPGITHWQHPSFFAYFPANSSYPSLLGEMLTAALGAQCMMWETSPAAAELEEKMMGWLKKLTGIPGEFDGVIQDTASTATLCALLSAREKQTDCLINEQGFSGEEKFRVYCSVEAHSSVEKAVKIAGIGRRNLVKVGVDDRFCMDVEDLARAIESDLNKGLQPLCLVVTLGTTGPASVDPLEKAAKIAEKYNLWLHVDAAYAGSALLLEEYRWMIKGIDRVDSFVFNPHKWLFTNFDCSAYFVREKEWLIKTFEILPEYLKTSQGNVNNYRDWGIQLGRRFRALKLWFVLRNFGLHGLQGMLRNHLAWARRLEKEISEDCNFELLAPVLFNVVCFRFRPEGVCDEEMIDLYNQRLKEELNRSGSMYLTHTRLNGKYTLRMVTGQTRLTEQHVLKAWELIRQTSRQIAAR